VILSTPTLHRTLGIRFLLLAIISFSFSSISAAGWTGYINDKSLNNSSYGYLVSGSKTNGQSKLKLVCFPPDNYRLYLDDNITRNIAIADIAISVDQLPEIALKFQRIGNSLAIANNTIQFWNLIAQMSAGAVFNVTAGKDKHYKYSLKGFTKTYLENCDWMTTAKNYRSYLDRYR